MIKSLFLFVQIRKEQEKTENRLLNQTIDEVLLK